MRLRYRVIFFDRLHGMHRSLVVEATSHLKAAELAYRWMRGQGIRVEEFAETVKVEIISTTEKTVRLSVIAKLPRLTAA